jgi:putative endopeptidase
MDLSVSPKKDFYQFSSGNWLKNAKIPDNNSSVDNFYHLTIQNLEKIQVIREEAASQSAKAPKGSVVQLVGDFYASGMDKDRIETLRVKAIEPELKQVAAIASKQDIAKPFSHYVQKQIAAVFAVAVFADEQRAQVNILTVIPDGYTLPKSYYSSSWTDEV